jgi:integrase
MAEARKRVESGAPATDSKITLATFAERWIEATLPESGVKASTQAVYRSVASRQIIGAPIGQRRLDALRPTDVEAWVAALRRAGRSDSGIRQAYAVLYKVLDTAVRDGHLGKNPAAATNRPTVARKEAAVMTDAQVRALLDAASTSRYWPVFRVLAATGMRRGEALALHWRDVDLDAGTLRVTGTLARVDGALTITAPKTQRSRRTVPLDPATVEVLRAHRARQAEERLAAGPAWRDNGLVFATEVGTPIEPHNALRAFKAAATRAGLTGVGLHTLRHSAATTMLRHGVPIHVVSTLLGHSSVAITGDTYGHVATDDAASAVAALAQSRDWL